MSKIYFKVWMDGQDTGRPMRPFHVIEADADIWPDLSSFLAAVRDDEWFEETRVHSHWSAVQRGVRVINARETVGFRGRAVDRVEPCEWLMVDADTPEARARA
ncbi:hypothetical protein [Leisingera daeponensis]|uniref:hypothetical protein n=1 Tax=Leisingera daeponensis TaxID=405746 RepID=UPI001C950657|nr:hypothetical protein [Leisingera daeponensis]MBY6055401.1 hypothetical protein [Leisingera daeponensis]